MKKGLLVVGLMLALIVGYVAADPYLTVSAIKAGIVEQDPEKLSDNIEFPTLRQNLKDQFNAAMMKNSATDLKDNPYAGFAMVFASKMVEGMVDSFITPSGLASIMEGKKPARNGSEGATTPPTKDSLFRNARFNYDSQSKFSIWVPNDQGKDTRIVLHRDGLSWKLVNIILPLDVTPKQSTQ